MSQTVIFPASTGRTLTAKLYTQDGATLVATASSCVEQLASGIYAAVFTGVPVGTYILNAADTVPANDADVYISSSSGFFQTSDLGGYSITSAINNILGPGASACVLEFEVGGNPIVGGQVWLTSDQAGTNIIAGYLYTDSNGKVTFMLTVGNLYYLWFVCSGYNSIQGQPYTAAAN